MFQGEKLRITVQVVNRPPQVPNNPFKTFEYVADKGMVIKAVGTRSASDIERYRRDI